MIYKIKKNSVSNYPTPVLQCVVLCYLNEEESSDENNTKFWIPFAHDLQCCIGKSIEEIDEMVRMEGERLFNEPNNQLIFEAIELGMNIEAPEIL